MKITGRQKDVLGKFLDLYREYQEPLHYNLVAERLGVSSVTAYDMLRLLEDRSLLRSEYVMPSTGQGPGRSTIVFSPTAAAHAFFAEMAGDGWDDAEWNEVKSRVLEGLRDDEDADYDGLLEEILARLSGRQKPLLFAADMTAATILSVLKVVNKVSIPALLERLFSVTLPGEVILTRLSGLVLGFNLDRKSPQISSLLSYVDDYLETLMQLSEKSKNELAGFAQEMLQVLH